MFEKSGATPLRKPQQGNAHQEKQPRIEKVNHRWLEKFNSPELVVEVQKVEVDEMVSFVGKKIYSRWLWHAIDHQTVTILAYVLGRREDRMFLKLKQFLFFTHISMS